MEFSRLAAKELAKLELKDSWEENLGAEGWEVKMDEKQRKKIVGASLMLQEIEEEERHATPKPKKFVILDKSEMKPSSVS